MLLTFGADGYYYEGFHYAAFSLHWVTRYLDALEHATGEDLYPRMRASFLPLKYYFAHSVVPDGVNVFDFGDTGMAFWRSGWDPAATAFAFRCGPPEGHHVTALLPRLPDWRLSSGHAHPDAGSFSIYANGKYLTGDAGYAGVPLTAHHNTVLFDGRGQAKEGRGHDAFADVPYERLAAIRINAARPGSTGAPSRCAPT